MNNSLLIMSAFALLITGCATGYKPSGWSGGYSDMRLGNDMYKVSFNGNGYTGSETVSNYFLRRCAELTIEQGFDYFAIVDQNASSSLHDIGTTTSGNINQNYTGGYNYTANTQTNYVRKHAREGVIKMFKTGTQPQVAFEAKEILKNFKD